MGYVLHRRVGKSSNFKFRLVVDSFHLKGTALGRFLRANGLREIELEIWRSQMASGLENHTKVNVDTKNDYKKKIAKLEKELRGAKAIIEGQKKVAQFLEDEALNTAKKPAKKSPTK